MKYSEENLLTVAQAAAFSGYGESTIYQWVQLGILAHVVIEEQIHIRRGEILRHIREARFQPRINGVRYTITCPDCLHPIMNGKNWGWDPDCPKCGSPIRIITHCGGVLLASTNNLIYIPKEDPPKPGPITRTRIAPDGSRTVTQEDPNGTPQDTR